jgi:hypothetical protein
MAKRHDELNFLGKNADWLRHSRVTHRVREERGRFYIDMIFTDRDEPLRKLVRTISDHPTRARAEWQANILQRQISGDARDPRPKPTDDADDIRRN